MARVYFAFHMTQERTLYGSASSDVHEVCISYNSDTNAKYDGV